MSILTDRDLEYLANLQKGWRRLYLSEVARRKLHFRHSPVRRRGSVSDRGERCAASCLADIDPPPPRIIDLNALQDGKTFGALRR
jgi:hypothetical protein